MLKMYLGCLLLILSFPGRSQHAHPQRCGTGAAMEAYFNKFPQYRKLFNSRLEQFRKAAVQKQGAPVSSRIQSTMRVPVVFHILLTDPGLVSDAQILSQLKIMNDDFGGLNADSTNIPPAFKDRFGKSTIQFSLAQRTPDDEPSTGITRHATATGSFPGLGDPVKYNDRGGVNAWDPSRFLNIWITEIPNGTLGYSFLPGTPGLPEAEMGLVLNYLHTGNTGTATPPFNLGRTATHELGHFFGLQHIWGASENVRSCSDSDGISDTPNQDTAHFGVPAFPQTDACTPSAPGVMFMNYMDYVNDVAMCLFTNGQAALMETALSTSSDRLSLLQSNGWEPPVVYTLDARITSATNVSNQAVLCAGNFSPSIVIRNSGTATLTGITAGYSLDEGPVQTETFTLQLASYTQTAVSLPLAHLTEGAHTLRLFVTNPNGLTDENPVNDTITLHFTANTQAGLPLSEGFESGTLPAGWYFRTSGHTNWQVTDEAAAAGSHAIYFPNFDTDEQGHYADLATPAIATGQADSLSLVFSVAASIYNPAFLDTLEVLVSADCGATFTSVYKKWGNVLITAPNSTGAFFPDASQWRKETLDLSAFRNQASIQVFFRNINRFGNNIFLDDIAIRGTRFVPDDATLTTITIPGERLCTPTAEPQASIRNDGTNTLRTLRIAYQLDDGPVQEYTWNGALDRHDTQLVTLPALPVTAGEHKLTVYSLLPNGNTDLNTSGDTLRKNFVRQDAIPLPVSESFEQQQFPPSGWFSGNTPAYAGSWTLATEAGYTGNQSVVAANANNPVTGARNHLATPLFNFGQTDSVYLSFRIAAHPRQPGNTDSLSIQLTTDCGLTYRQVYLKSASELTTATTPAEGIFTPTGQAQWRRDSVNLTPFLAQSNTFYLVFRNINNFDNHIYLDDVNVYTHTLPPRLREEGLLVSPTVFSRTLVVQHYMQPAGLRFIRLINTAGQQVYSRQYNGNASSYIELNTGSLPAGIYFIQLGYADRNVTKKIVKTP